MIGEDDDEVHRPLPVVLRPIPDELLSSWLARHAAYYSVSELSTIGWALRKSRACQKNCDAIHARSSR
jgi:hypothetical protein